MNAKDLPTFQEILVAYARQQELFAKAGFGHSSLTVAELVELRGMDSHISKLWSNHRLSYAETQKSESESEARREGSTGHADSKAYRQGAPKTPRRRP